MKNEKPNIFFPGEKDSWKKYELKEISDIYDGTHQTPKYTAKGIPFVSVENINDIYNSKKFISVADYDSNFKNKTEIGNLFMTRITAGVIGATAVIETNKPIAYYVSLALIKPFNVVNSWFLNYVMSASRFKKELNKRIIHTAFPKKINLADIGTCSIYIPLMNEQKKIGSFFKDLDDTISLHQQEFAVLKQTKQGFLQKMFPKDGESIPEIRFPEFTNNWTYNKLGDICKVTLGQSPNGQNYTENPNDYILVQGNADIKKGRVHPRVWTTQVTKTANPGDIILCVRAPVGDVAKTSHKVVLGRGVASIEGNEFLYHLLYKMKKGGYWARYSTGSTFESINSTDIKEAVVMLPSEEEQIKIGEFFRQLDEVIELKEKEVEALKETKKGFLQKIFI